MARLEKERLCDCYVVKLETEQAMSAKFESKLEAEALQYQNVDRRVQYLLSGKGGYDEGRTR